MNSFCASSTEVLLPMQWSITVPLTIAGLVGDLCLAKYLTINNGMSWINRFIELADRCSISNWSNGLFVFILCPHFIT